VRVSLPARRARFLWGRKAVRIGAQQFGLLHHFLFPNAGDFFRDACIGGGVTPASERRRLIARGRRDWS
jgi:hypothetical protein